MSTAIQTRIRELTDEVRDVFAQVTRYPVDILEPHASLEEDLGIDSVKLGEVFAVLREKYQLPDKLNIPRENLRSIESLAVSLREHIEQNPIAAPLPAAHVNGNGNGHVRHGAPAASREDFLNQVRDVFCAVTRYPEDILEPNASLEEDLGIDSVKMGEVFAVLREKYGLPAAMDLPREQLKTIAGIAESLSRYVADSSAVSPAPTAPVAPPVAAATPVSQTPAHAAEDFDEQVRAIFAEVTRYPIDILEPAASLEEDLGIDSVKLGEVFAVLRERYNLPEVLDAPRESMKTIGTIAEALRKHVDGPLGRGAHNAPGSLNGHSNGIGRGSADVVEQKPPVALARENKPFEGKIALVTGSGRALGKDVAVYLASLGATVIVNSFHSREQGVKTVEEIVAAGGKAIHAWGSVANPHHVESIFEQIEQTYGGLDFFVSNASNGMLARLEDLTPEHFEKAYRTNVIGLHQCALRAVNLMKRRGGGKIITLSSPASHGYVDYFGCMATVKAAVESLTKSMAIEFARYNIQVNCVSPGPIYGDLLNKWPESKRLIAEWEQATVCDRLCVDRDVSHFIAYLLGDAVKLFTGSVLVMDGGISVRWGGVSGAAEANAGATAHSANSQQQIDMALPAYR
jgi:NAD(P)-dependent dehydrogenase (short-subunit alcohol dehydrogenase family)/acyl carrier protein